VCAPPRSGSSFLCEVLSSTGVAGRPDDFFWNPPFWFADWGVADFDSFAQRLFHEGTSTNGVFGSKLMWDQLDYVAKQFATLLALGEAALPHVLGTAFPNLHYIWLSRRDKIRQGISYYRALETKIWRSTDVSNGAQVEPSFNFEAIRSLVQLCTSEDQAWNGYFRVNGIEPCTVVYEDLLESPADVARQVLSYLAVPPPASLFSQRAWRHRRQSDATSEEWRERYDEYEHAVQRALTASTRVRVGGLCQRARSR
jgi:LPS sulfotransferase NodH